jgi:hypothetical protein
MFAGFAATAGNSHFRVQFKIDSSFNYWSRHMKTEQKTQPAKLKKFAIREVEELKTTAAAAYVCWICSNCW